MTATCVPSAATARWSPGRIGRRATPSSSSSSANRGAAASRGNGTARAAAAAVGVRRRACGWGHSRTNIGISSSSCAAPSPASSSSVVSACLRRARRRTIAPALDAVTDPAAAAAAPADAANDAPSTDGSRYDQVGEHAFDLPQLTASSSSREDRFDLTIVGCGPAGLAAADRASSKGLRVALVDPRPLALWRNNYGVWVDEFEALGLADCFNCVWPTARVVVDDDRPDGIKLQRPYAQVNRKLLKDKLLRRCVEQGVVFGSCAVDDVDHERGGSVVSLKGGEDGAYDGQLVYSKMVLDATGHARKLVDFERDFTPGYQAAFGIMCETEEPHGFPLDTMLFMDWRDAHLDDGYKAMNNDHPTFLYAMPFTATKIFFEETSLVERPGLEFDDLKVKLQQRLESLGVRVKRVDEEEYCLIPMGGVLPKLPQRTLGVGGTAGMVHPSTGFMVSKTLLSVRGLVDTLAEELQAAGEGEEVDADAVADKVWRSVWPDDELRMRTFMCFGMETLMELDIKGTRQFFETFFKMSQDIWGGFLSWRIQPAGLVKLGAILFFKFSNYMRFKFVWSALPFMASFVKNFATADNSFNSDKWGGLVLKKSEGDSTFPGQGPIPRPDSGYNPAATPITSSPLDFTELVGGDVNTPRHASSLRPDREWIEFQQRKVFKDQAPIVDVLDRLSSTATVDALVVGAGPAGLAVAAEMAERGVSVGLIAPDTPFVNNYGVWLDEFKELGLEHCLLHSYDDALVWFNDTDPAGGIGLGRGYGQVCRRRLREELLGRCKRAGVKYAPGLVDTVVHGDAEKGEPSVVTGSLSREEDDASEAEAEAAGAGPGAAGEGSDASFEIKAKIVVCSTGHNRDMLKYEEGRAPGWQTAYGVEVKMPGHPFPPNKAVFMDFRQSDPEVANQDPEKDLLGVWRVPSFLYVLPVDEDTVFVEETCLVARVQVPFDELKRRLYRRLSRMGLSVEKENILEEEASWIPLKKKLENNRLYAEGGTPPVAPQRTLAFGAAAGLVHPASGFSIVNSLRRAPSFADAVVSGLKEGGSVVAAERGWEVLWGDEPRRQIGFYQFGMELLMSLRIEQMRNFFTTFFQLPLPMYAGFLSNDLSSAKLMQFALTCFIAGNWELRALLLTHLTSAGAGVRLGQAYAHPLLKAAGLTSVGQEIPRDNELYRKDPPQEPNFNSFAKDLFSAEEQGMMPGFQSKDWWAVGSGSQSSKDDSDANANANADGDGDDGSSSGGGVGTTTGGRGPSSGVGGVGGGATMEFRATDVTGGVTGGASQQCGAAGGDQGAMAYWSDGSAALVMASAVRKTGLTAGDLYGQGRKKFLPTAMLSFAGPEVVPPYLTGELPGDAGWDPLQMGAQRDIMKLREREIIHGRWAMLATLGVLTPEVCAKLSVFGSPGQHWWNTAVVWPVDSGVPELTYLGETIPWEVAWLPVIHLPLFFVAELLRTGQYKLDAFENLDRMYPGGKLFDPLGIGRDLGEEDLKILKTIEIQHCRLAMIAFFGFFVEAVAWGAGPLDFWP